MDIYWAHVLEKEYRNHTKEPELKQKLSQNSLMKDILCGICGQNKYWCVCDNSFKYKKFDSNQSSLTQDKIVNDASQAKEQN
jgi:CDGSH-type Zn-finger protein